MQNDNNYEHKPETYFGHPRTDIASCLPREFNNVLDVGCGSGATLKWLKDHQQERQQDLKTTGIELFEQAGKLAQQVADRVLIGPIEEQQQNLGSQKFDLILALDVLEHLTDPWATLASLAQENLKETGTIIISLPNVQHLHVLKQLLFRGDWHYENSGILDKTHLRFFTHKTAVNLIDSAGLRVTNTVYYPGDFSKKQKVFNAATMNLLKAFVTQRYIFSTTRKNKS